jgi:hypothetical protein
MNKAASSPNLCNLKQNAPRKKQRGRIERNKQQFFDKENPI